MADLRLEEQRLMPYASRPHWNAIWAGVFTFMGIWSVFGLLGMAIFSSAANPSHAIVSGGIGAGMAIWAIILTIIAMYVAGRVTGKLAGLDRSANGMIHGMIMFGLSIASVLVLAAIGNTATTTTAQTMPAFLHAYAGLGWAGFLSLFFGWLAAMGGAATGQHKAFMPVRNAPIVHEVPHAA